VRARIDHSSVLLQDELTVRIVSSSLGIYLFGYFVPVQPFGKDLLKGLHQVS
jgi:hypothetical protein